MSGKSSKETQAEDSNILTNTAPQVHVIQTRSSFDASVQLAAVFVLKDEGLQSGAKVAGRSHSIIRSARPSSDCGIASFIALAVLRLITSLNLVGCSTGRSAGFAPLKIRST